jgi:hypothetical protein
MVHGKSHVAGKDHNGKTGCQKAGGDLNLAFFFGGTGWGLVVV